MIDLQLRYIKASGILCFDEVEIHFSDYGQVVQIIGENLDVPPAEDGRPASNGSGKSSIQDLISLGFYGRTVKKPKKIKAQNFINDKSDVGTVEICWNDCRVVRTYKRKGANKLQLWECKDHIWDSDTEINKGVNETQEEITKKVGLTHEAFCNVVVFDDSRDYDFLEADAKLKREIVENLLGLERFRLYGQTAKDKLKEIKVEVADLTKEYERLTVEYDTCESRISKIKEQESTWRANKENEIKKLYVRFKGKQSDLESTDIGTALKKYEDAQERIEQLEIEQEKAENQRAKLEQTIRDAGVKLEVFKEQRDEINVDLQGHLTSLQTYKKQLSEANSSLQKLESLEEGATCPVCHAKISKDNYGHVMSHEQNTLSGLRSKIEKTTALAEQEKKKFGQKSATINKAEEKIGEAQNGLTNLSDRIRQRAQEITKLREITKPEGDSAVQVLEAEVTEMKRQLAAMKKELDGESPYKEILEEAEGERLAKQKECQSKSKEVKAVESRMPYYKFWVEAFGDKGIRKYVIDGIIPSLNSRIAYWMQHLIDGHIELTFDNELEVEVTRNGNPTNYHNLSNGEKQRVNLSISQSFAHIMMLNSGTQPSLVFLDEITGGGIDRAGVSPVYNTIFELAKERQVFVTTHNENLMAMLDGCETILLRKQDDVTRIVS